MRCFSLSALIACSLLFSQDALADRILKVDGTSLDDVSVTKEGLLEVEYKSASGRTAKTVPTQEVLRVVYEKLPEQIDSAETAMVDEMYLGAVNDLQEFLSRFSEKPPRTFPWAVPYARYRLMTVYESMGSQADVVAAADEVLAKSADSRYAILAHIAKIEALNLMGQTDALPGAVKAFSDFVTTNSLPSRWRLEAELRGVLYGSKKSGAERRTASTRS
ncbi:MAG: hypothetical protein R3F17_08365 [Planctomycetota bacterium]